MLTNVRLPLLPIKSANFSSGEKRGCPADPSPHEVSQGVVLLFRLSSLAITKVDPKSGSTAIEFMGAGQ
jgi:hypothetical protein